MTKPVSFRKWNGEVVFALISLAASGGLLCNARGTKRAYLLGCVLNMAGGAQTITFRTGTGLLSGAMDVPNDGFLVLPYNPLGWFRGNLSSDLNIVGSGATLIAGHALVGYRDF